MLKRSFPRILIVFALSVAPILAQDPLPTAQAVFTAGQDGYHTFRIPAVVRTPKGTLLAFCEGRKGGRGDAGDIDLIVRRSEDEGKSWGPIQMIWDDGPNTIGNPCPVVDERSGAVVLLLTRNLGKDHERQIIDGSSQGTREVWVCRSEDDGRSFSKPREITSTAKKSSWSWYATGPGNGIQLRTPPHAGRLVIPCDHIEKGTKRYLSHLLLSDDGGKSWRIGGISPQAGVNECAVAELPSGALLLNMRNAYRKDHQRAVALSSDGGETLGNFERDQTLVEPRCQASLVALPGSRRQPSLLAFSNPASAKKRHRLSVRWSLDDGLSWPGMKLLHEGPAAYSSLVPLGGRRLGCLYEAGVRHPYESIRWQSLELPAPKAMPLGIIGASVSAGFFDPRNFANRSTSLLRVMREIYPKGLVKWSDESTSWLFRDVFGKGPPQVAAMVEHAPSLVLAVDFPFWFGYGHVGRRAGEEEITRRLDLQRRGFRLLDRLEGPVIIGNYPDMRDADPTMLPPSMVPSPDAITALNESIVEWSKTRERMHFFDLAAFVANIKQKGAEVEVGGKALLLTSKQLLQTDRLHPNPLGSALLAIELQKKINAIFPRGHRLHRRSMGFEAIVRALRAESLLRKAMK